jgi:hypothetical protein
VTAATSPTAEAVAAATTTAETAGTRFTRASFIHRKSSAAQLSAVQSGHRFIRIAIYGHFDECETPCLAGIPVLHNLNSIDLSVCGKGRIQILLCRLERNVPDIYVLQGVLLHMLPWGRLISRELISAG